MAMTQEHADVVQEVKEAVEKLRKEVMNSMSLRAVGGAHLANELAKLPAKLDEVKAAIEADIAEPQV